MEFLLFIGYYFTRLAHLSLIRTVCGPEPKMSDTLVLDI